MSQRCRKEWKCFSPSPRMDAMCWNSFAASQVTLLRVCLSTSVICLPQLTTCRVGGGLWWWGMRSDGISEICKSNHFLQRRRRHINKPLNWRLFFFFVLPAAAFYLQSWWKNAKQVLRSLWLPVFLCPDLSYSLITIVQRENGEEGKKNKQ